MTTKMITVRGKAFSSYKAVPLTKATRMAGSHVMLLQVIRVEVSTGLGKA